MVFGRCAAQYAPHIILESTTQTVRYGGISIGSAVFAGLTTVADRQTDRHRERPTDHTTQSVTIDRIFVRSTVVLGCGLKIEEHKVGLLELELKETNNNSKMF